MSSRTSRRRQRMRRPRGLIPMVSVIAALTLLAGVFAGVKLLSGWGEAPAAGGGKSVAVQVVRGHKVKIPVMNPWHGQPVSWPAPDAGAAVITTAVTAPSLVSRLRAGPSAGSGRAGGLPVWVGPPDSASSPTPRRTGTDGYLSSSSPVTRATVGMAAHATASALGVRGVVFTVSRADGRAGTGRVHVSLDYAAFADAYGGNYAARLHLVELPGCALTTPRLARCRQQVQPSSADDVRTSRVGADVTLPGLPPLQTPSLSGYRRGSATPAVLTSSVTAPALVLAALASPSGSGGNYGAEPVSEAKDWVTGGSSGAFTYSYPVSVPPVPGGLEPEVSLDYDSQAADGLTSSTNNEASWVGDGWDYSPGFIEAEYLPCSQSGLFFAPDTSDLCGNGELSLSLNGVTTPLVHQSGETYRAEADGAAKITSDGNSWEVIEPDGTQYYFGLNELPGYATGDATTNSSWTAPVYLGCAGQDVFCNTQWRWMLDYVVDPHGNAIAYFYNTQTNYYAEDDGTTGSAAYTQGGTLAKIEYGLRAGDIYGYTPAAQVIFTTSSTTRTDAPTDLTCAQGAACSVTAPTFWTPYALASITTQSLQGGTLHNVDSWSLAGTYPATGDATTTPPSLWLSSVTRTGEDGTTNVTLPPVSFAGTAMPNLVATPATTAAGYSLITRFRLTAITNETGGVTSVSYSSPDVAPCASGDFPAPYSNTAACYPDYWLPTGSSSPVQDWFNLYTTSSVTEKDTTGADPPVVTSYSYSGAAWAEDSDTVSRSVTETYDQWRGYRTVTTEAGTSPDPVSETVDTYFQGLDGTDVLTSTRGDRVTDLTQYAGLRFEEIVYNGAGSGNEVTDTVNIPYTSTATATDKTLNQASYIVGSSSVDTYTALAGGGTRESTQTYTYNTYGEILSESDVPDTSNAAEDSCTATTYYTDTTDWVLDLPESVQVLDIPCNTYPSQASQLVSDTQYTYDSSDNLTETQLATSVSYQPLIGFQFTFTTEETATYDQYGRVLTSTDADNRTTTTAYTPVTGAEPTSVQVTDPQKLVTTTTYDPARDLPLTVTDPASYQTTDTYDALGRVTGVWTPGNPTSGPAVDKYTYAVSDTAPSVTTEQTEEPSGGYLTAQTLYDSLGQVRETQTATAGGDTDVADTTYNSDGWRSVVTDPYYISGAPSGTLVAAAPGTVPSETGYVYDGDGRVTRQVSYTLGAETWETDNTYGGNYVTTVPPTGGTSTTTFTDGRDLTTAIYQYHAGVPASPSDPAADYDQTSYTYTGATQLASITDVAQNTWSYTYDLLGNQLTATDPDAGKTTSTYDAASQLMTVTDARGKTISYTYDADGRRTAEYDTTGGALESPSTELASWTYDTLAKGQLTSSTAYSGGSAYTEAVTAYNTYEQPSGVQTVIPSAQGTLAGTYTQQMAYAPSGQELSYTDSAAGGLPSETVTTGYDSAGEPNSLTGSGSYVDSLSYTNLGQPLQYKMGTSTEPAYITDSYDPQTGRVTEQNTQTGSANTSVDDLHYKYDDVGNVLSEADTPSGNASATDVQCFQYDYLGRMVQAWAQGSASCASSPSASVEGGAAPYWDSYSYASTGNMTGITSTTAAGAATTTADTYPAAQAAQPHGISTQKVTTSSGSTTTSYGYDPAGHLTTLTSTAQSEALTWDDAGQLAQVAITPSGGSAKDTSYVYDADNTLLLTADPTSKTLYLSDEELTLNTGTGTVTGTRYYSLGGVIVAARTGASTVAYLAGDLQGTSSVAVDSGTLAVTHRYFDPYGNTRGTTPSAWPEGEKGFVGGADDTATGLTDLGAREYQPGTGSFISPDPLLNPYQPQDLNAYAYAADNPATNSDPSGALMITGGSTGCVGSAQAVQACNSKAQTEEQQGNDPRGQTHPPSDPAGSGGRMVCNGGVCASVPYWHKHPKPAPVSRPETSEKPEFSCEGPAADLRGWKGVCQAASHPNEPFPWKYLLNAAGAAAAIACALATDGEGQSICDLASGEAAAQIPTAESLASELADATGGTLEPLKSGYSVTIPEGSRGIVVRVMDEGGVNTNYYRISIPGKETFTVTGDASSDRALTHIPISSTSLRDILNIIARIKK